MLVDEPQIVLEDLEAAVLLAEGVVGLAVLEEPGLVDGSDVVVGSEGGVGVVVGDDGHVEGGGGEDEEEGEGES